MKNLWLACILTIISLQGFTQNHTQIYNSIDRLVNTYYDYHLFNGSVLVAEKGKVIYEKGLGLANRELEVENEVNTIFHLGSITKQFTAMLILQLVEKGQLDLDSKISVYLPDYPYEGRDKITIQHLLTHSSGIPRFRLDVIGHQYEPLELLDMWKYEKLDFEPGSKCIYSNPGYFLLGVIIEQVTQKPFDQVLQENILDPLGMKHSGIDNKHAILKQRASPYTKIGKDYLNGRYFDMSVPYAAGAMYSTLHDLLLWDQALYTDKLLSRKYLDMMFSPQIKFRDRHYGYGWFIRQISDPKSDKEIALIDHDGGLPGGYSCRITRIPSKNQTVIVLGNVERAEFKDFSASILAILNDWPYSLPKKSMADELMDILLKKGIIEARQFFTTNREAPEYQLNEREVNSHGYYLLRQGETELAIELMKLNVLAFPTSANAYDSLGEAYLMQGNKKLASENYKKVLELDPANMHALKMLEELSK